MKAAVEVVNSRSLLVCQKPTSFLADFDFFINPYCGCTFQRGPGRDGTRPGYCYVPDVMPAQVARRGGWGRFVPVRTAAVDVLERALPKLAGKRALLSPATEVYRPLEREYCLTRQLLQLLPQSELERVCRA